MTEIYDVDAVEAAVWKAEYTGGMSIAANALFRIESMFAEDRRSHEQQIAVFLTDGYQPVMEIEAYMATRRLDKAGVEMFVVGTYTSEWYLTRQTIAYTTSIK